MKKIPIQHLSDKPAAEPLAPRYLLEAVETLLLGALWLFVLIWIPFYQSVDQVGVPLAVFKVHWITVVGLALVLLVLGWQQRRDTPVFHWAGGCLCIIAGCSVLALISLSHNWLQPYWGAVCVTQSLLGLVYFALSRVRLP